MCWTSRQQLLACLLLAAGPLLGTAGDRGGQHFIQGTAEGWRKRAIYQVLTDRLDAPKLQYAEGGDATACNVSKLSYCGGTFASVEARLDYIRGMNFGAVWISPTVVNAPGGYHGYWPVDLYSTNSNFGTMKDLQRLLGTAYSQGLWVMADVVLNHVGYGDILHGYNPFYKDEHFHNCSILKAEGVGCSDTCSIPSVPILSPGASGPNQADASEASWRVQWDCQLAGLRDLDQSAPGVRAESLHWLDWYQAQFGFQGMRIDAMGHVNASFWPDAIASSRVFALGEVWHNALVSEVARYAGAIRHTAGGPAPAAAAATSLSAAGSSPSQPYSFMDMTMAFALRNVFGMEQGPQFQSCRQISSVIAQYRSVSIDQGILGRFIDNHDITRFQTLLVDNGLPNSRLTSALAFIMLAEGIPIVYYGTEARLEGKAEYDGNRQVLSQTRDLNEVAKDSNGVYLYIKKLNWYRFKQELWSASFVELSFQQQDAATLNSTFAFKRTSGDDVYLVVVLCNDAARRTVTLPGLQPGRDLCDIELLSCFKVTDAGVLSITLEGNGAPVVLVDPAFLRSNEFFSRPKEGAWKGNSFLSVGGMFLSLAGAVVSGFLIRSAWLRIRVVSFFRRVSQHVRKLSSVGAAPYCDSDPEQGGEGGPLSKAGPGRASPGLATVLENKDGSSGRGLPVKLRSVRVGSGELRRSPGTSSVCFKPPSMTSALINGSPFLSPAGNDISPFGGDGQAVGPEWMRPLRMRSIGPPRTSTNAVGIPSLDQFKRGFKVLPDMVLHVTLEYTVPHMGFTTALTYGGLGKMVDVFIRCSTVPIAVVAPMYAPFYDSIARERLPETDPLLSFSVRVGGESEWVDVFMTTDADHSENVRCYMFLLQSRIFRDRTRGSIYQHLSEEEQLTFLSVFNQSASIVINTFRFQSVQFHDYHGVLSLMYLSEAAKPSVMYVAHNADYNGAWALGSPGRERYLYSMFNLPINRDTRMSLEHQGNFDMLRSLTRHLQLRQGGMGVVGVSPRYAERAAHKFSQFWRLPKNVVKGVLNGVDDKPEGFDGITDALLAAKAQAKAQLQASCHLLVGQQYQLFVFLGRLTHQKGGDLVAAAAKVVLAANDLVQFAVGGPIGDSWGAEARELLKEVAAAHPGRVWNGAGQYVSGAAKDRLVLAADFCLCPSRFEPCGLVDIEFGWQGALMVGHNCGGLGKMPGFYFRAELDNIQDMAHRLELAIYEALEASPSQRRAMVVDAINKDFSPQLMVGCYNQIWREIHSAVKAAKAKESEGRRMSDDEAAFYKEDWLVDNKPFDAAAPPPPQARWYTNLSTALLILMQVIMQIPSIYTMIFYLQTSQPTGLISFSDQPVRLGMTGFYIYFTLYAAGAILWQAIAFFMSPRSYIRLACLTFLASVLAAYWAVFVPWWTQYGYLLTSVCAAAWAPLIGFILLERKNRFSVSQWGPALMGFTDATRYLVLFLAFLALYLGIAKTQEGDFTIDARVYQGGAMALLVLATWLLMWFSDVCGSGLLSAHYTHFRLRLRSQLGLLLLHRRAWLAVTAMVALDSFCISFNTSYVYQMPDGQTLLFKYVCLMFATGAVAMAAVAALLSVRLGQVRSLGIMRGLALLPGLLAVQAALLTYGRARWPDPAHNVLVVAAVVPAMGVVRMHITGLLQLHTLPSRETLSLAQSAQIFAGSVCIALGGLVGFAVNSGCGRGCSPVGFPAGPAGFTLSGGCRGCGWPFVLLVSVFEALRLALGVLMLWLHKHENIAVP
ncbi:hypothetical protein WJX81_000502 [Elliptochloris bilobata]|uniref:Glycosyl hydrolase family 13 catalytic domain-containing protein n=1 Tax=Elliptochloris bilobata TaxID=381761 RepID=A0AAW1SHC4_9CHLO